YCVMQRDYTAAELSVGVGETITAEILESGWAWASGESGDSGWIPLSHLAADPTSSTPYLISIGDQARMLRKLMLYWDGQWFLNTAETFGLEPAIDLNARVRASFGRIEMRQLLKTLGKSEADDLADALHLLETYARAFMGTRLRAEFFFQGPNRAEIIVRRCAAYEGAKRAALPRADQACIACETLWDAWLETLMPDRQVEIRYPTRQGKGDSICQFQIRLDVQEENV
ncbi:MAG: SH3 domain-containing protein, partial [Anaerolineae bacterium]